MRALAQAVKIATCLTGHLDLPFHGAFHTKNSGVLILVRKEKKARRNRAP